MLTGNIYLSNLTPLHYVLSLTIYKSPEYLLFLYIFFIIFFFKISIFLKLNFKFFYYKLILILTIIFFPTIILMLSPFAVYDGLRLFLWYIPYTTIIPALALFYFFENYKILTNKIILLFTFFFFTFYVYAFFAYTPFQYTYLNFFSGQPAQKHTQFVNDYWGVTFHELIEKINKSKFAKKEKISVYFWGFNNSIDKKNIKSKAQYISLQDKKKSDFIILNNRTFSIKSKNKIELKNCYFYLDKKIINVTRMGHELSVFGKIKKQ